MSRERSPYACGPLADSLFAFTPCNTAPGHYIRGTVLTSARDMDQPLLDERFRGIDRLYGAGSAARLAAAHVCIVGIGGVGSWAVEALARSGVGRLTLIDADEVCVSNTNRQLHALDGTFGRTKVDVMAERARAINPAMHVDAIAEFLTPSNLETLLGRGYDLVLDCCDAFRVKVEMIAWCQIGRAHV